MNRKWRDYKNQKAIQVQTKTIQSYNTDRDNTDNTGRDQKKTLKKPDCSPGYFSQLPAQTTQQSLEEAEMWERLAM